MIELLAADWWYPVVHGLSGIITSNLSNFNLNDRNDPPKFLTSLGRQLNSLGPSTGKEFSIQFLVLVEETLLMVGTLHKRSPLTSPFFDPEPFIVEIGNYSQ